jgi:hypothetical protein
MTHPTEDDLILHHYGEAAQPPGIDGHLAACGSCRLERERIAADLARLDRIPVPERGDDYGLQVWRKLRTRLPEPEAPARAAFFPAWRLSAALALFAVAAAAFLTGRLWPRPAAVPRSAEAGPGLAAESRERILLLAVADQLDRSQIALLEFLHADDTARAESSHDRDLARELIASSRLYRQTAAQAGKTGLASVLDDVERVLIEIANSPSPEARAALRRRIESEGTLFKVRIVRAQLQEREKTPEPPGASRS